MKLQLKGWQLKDLKFNIINPNLSEGDKKNDLKLSVGRKVSQIPQKEFFIIFEVAILDKNFDLKVEMAYSFEASIEITEDMIDSPFLQINAPAIAFPFLRAFISNFTLQSGIEPIILPSINFVELSEDQECEREEFITQE